MCTCTKEKKCMVCLLYPSCAKATEDRPSFDDALETCSFDEGK